MMHRRFKLATLVVAGALIAGAGCANDPKHKAAAESGIAPAASKLARATFVASGSIEQATVTHAEPGMQLSLVDRDDRVIATGAADALGSKVFYGLAPGAGYRVVTSGTHAAGSPAFSVLNRDALPPETLYSGQALQQGINYVRMRDGITLAMTVRLPAGKALDDGPFPTLIEYSGYGTAAPHDLLSSITAQIADPKKPADPLAPDTATAVGSLIAPLLDFATVSVQIRGSGCSGGAFDLFGLPTIYDGYDAIETVAAQPWVTGHKVGMVGISYSGYSQLFVGGTRPPHLAALAPMSVTDDLYDGIGFPGGIFNTGFAKGWLTERQSDGRPGPEGGQSWAKAEIAAGDTACLANQALHGQARDGLKILSKVEFREPALFDDRVPGEWAKRIDVPTFLVGGLQDEQLGSHWAHVIPALADNPDTWVTMYNGNHNDALQPAVLSRWVEFLNLFVADRIPSIPDGVRGFAGLLFDQISHVPAIPLAQSRFAKMTDVDAARNLFRLDPRIRVLLDVGGGSLGPGALQPVWEITSPTWPMPDTVATRWYLGADGALTSTAPTTVDSESYVADPAARPATSLSKDTPQRFADEVNNWTPVADGKGLAWVSAPLTSDVVIAGTSSLDLAVKAEQPDVDIQATLSEVRPDGQETYVETGWLRASHRALDEKRSTELDPEPTHQAKDSSPLPSDHTAPMRISINPVVHAFRAGSRIRVTVQAPGGDRPLWTFDTDRSGTNKVTVVSSSVTPSSLALPVVAGRVAGAPLPACDTLRGQPCRRYVPAANGG
ncbi:MAG: CocE/NonD family hydrolase [Acidimicrobiales bacterium]